MTLEGVGVIVLTYGSTGVHGPLFESLLEEGVSPSGVVAVHNPASPGEPDPILPGGCDLVRADRNLGYAGGMNLGVARWRERGEGADLLLCLTHDARLREGALHSLLEAAHRHPGYGVLAPALVLDGTDEPFSFGGVTSASGATSHVKDPPGSADEIFACDWVDGGTMLIRREVFDRVGGFDERFWGYCEESDLCLRAKRAGFGIGVVPAATADQDPGGSKRIGAWAYLLTRNGIAYARRAAGARGLVATVARAIWQVAFSLLRAGLRATHLRPGDPGEQWTIAVATARGILDYFRGRWGPPPVDLPGMGDLRNA